MGRSRTNLTTKQAYLAPRAEAAAVAAASAASTAAATDQVDATASTLQDLQLQQQHPASASVRQQLEACYGLEHASSSSSSLQEASSSSAATTRRYLCYFLHRLLDFRVPELAALADMYGVPDVRCEAPAGEHGSVCPFWYVHLPNEQVAAQIVARAVLIRGIFELWGEGSSFEEMAAAVAALPAAVKEPYCGPATSFKIVLDAWGHTWSEQQQQELLDRCPQFLPSQGKVSLRAPQQTFWLACARLGGANGLPASNARWYFGRQVALADRSWVKAYALPWRAYIGPTSMDPEVAFIMTNLAQVSRGSLVLDPYVGTGSILIAAAARGAHTMGCDIDVRVLKQGRRCPKTGKQVDIYSNYEQYGLQYPVGLVRMDVHTHPFRAGLREVFNVILGDPPYGVRAGGRKLVAKAHPIRFRASHIPSTEPYSLTECLADLLELAAATLVTGGRLVFFMPASPETYREDQLPRHPMLRIVSNVEQPLQSRYSRRLVTMLKVKPYDPVVAAQFKEARKDFVMDIDRLHDIVYAQDEQQQQQQQGQGSGSLDGFSEGGGVVRVKAKYRSKMC